MLCNKEMTFPLYIHVRLAKAPVAWYGLHPLELQQRENSPIRRDSMELATAHDIKPCTALNQSTNYNRRILLQPLQRHIRSVTHTYKTKRFLYTCISLNQFLGLFSATWRNFGHSYSAHLFVFLYLFQLFI